MAYLAGNEYSKKFLTKKCRGKSPGMVQNCLLKKNLYLEW